MPTSRNRSADGALSGRGARKVTLRDVAQLAGVHAATVSRVLAPETRVLVNEETARRVEQAIEQLGYQPNPLARGLKTRRSTTIGVLVTDLTNPLFPPIVRGIEDRLLAASYTALLANTDGRPERERHAYEILSARQVDGFIMATAFRQDPLVDEAVERGVPVVLAVRTTDSRRAPAVIFDDDLGMRRAVEHLVELGHRQIAHLAGPQTISNGARRRAAFLASMSEHGLTVLPGQIVEADAFTLDQGEQAVARLLDADVPFSAVIAGNDLMAVGALSALAAAGRSCPQDVSVVGFNDMPLADRLSPPLTSLHVPHHDLGVQAAELLLERLRDPDAPVREVSVEETLVVRGSTAPPGA